MRAKEYLEQLGGIMDNLERRQEQLEELRRECFDAKAVRYDRDIVQNSGKNVTEERMIRYLDKAREIEGVMAYYFQQKDKLIGQIEELAEDAENKNGDNYASLLYKRYVERKRFEQIAKEMDYSHEWVRHMHKSALKAFWRMHLRETQNDTYS